jgi:hypothetical protein
MPKFAHYRAVEKIMPDNLGHHMPALVLRSYGSANRASVDLLILKELLVVIVTMLPITLLVSV